jgi:hypothetical protein
MDDAIGDGSRLELLQIFAQFDSTLSFIREAVSRK